MCVKEASEAEQPDWQCEGGGEWRGGETVTRREPEKVVQNSEDHDKEWIFIFGTVDTLTCNK